MTLSPPHHAPYHQVVKRDGEEGVSMADGGEGVSMADGEEGVSMADGEEGVSMADGEEGCGAWVPPSTRGDKS